MTNWNDKTVKIPEFLTSPDPIERIKGKIFLTLKNSSSDCQKIGDELFASAVKKYVEDQFRIALNGNFISEKNTKITIDMSYDPRDNCWTELSRNIVEE